MWNWLWLLGGLVGGFALGAVFTCALLFSLGSTLRPMRTLPRVAATPVTPPGGASKPSKPLNGRIAFASNRDGHYEIYVANLAGVPFGPDVNVAAVGGLTRITNDRANDLYPAWSPDGQRIAYSSDQAGHPDIYVMNADGSAQTRLTHDEGWDAHPVWSPDGKRIAFKSDRLGDWDIYAMNLDGSGQTRLTFTTSEEDNPSWSPDGQYIAFNSWATGNHQIYVISADGTHKTRLTDNGADDWAPAWSPDGRRIAFVSNRDGATRIYVMKDDGSGQVALSSGDLIGEDEDPAWSPDGQYIMFASKDRDEHDPWSGIFVGRITWADGDRTGSGAGAGNKGAVGGAKGSGRTEATGGNGMETMLVFSGPSIDRDPNWAPK